MTIEYDEGGITVHHGDCIEILAQLPDNSVDSVVCDPPYGLEFMGKDWDKLGDRRQPKDPIKNESPHRRSSTGSGVSYGGTASYGADPRIVGPKQQQWHLEWTAECLRVLKPGGHLLAFGGTRTWHRLACAVEDAGFEVRDSIAWLYGSGFPKSLDVSKAIDKAAGAEREVVGPSPFAARKPNGSAGVTSVGLSATPGSDITAPATDAARQWQGWGTALKPAFETVVVARKPLTGTVAANVLAHGTGALNIDGCRIGDGEDVVTFDRAAIRSQGGDGGLFDLLEDGGAA